MPPLADVEFLYSDRSSQDFQPSAMGAVLFIKRISFRLQARALLRDLGDFPGKIVDFGCGSGLLTRCLGDVAKGRQVIGMDYHVDPPIHLEGRPYRSAMDSEEIEGAADGLVAMHVLEHAEDVSALLGRMVRLVRPGGTMIIEVPHIDCMWASLFGRFWDAWYVPYHRVHFTRASLQSVVEQQGLTVEWIRGVSVPGLGRSIANLLKRPNSLPFILLTAILQPLQKLGEVITGRPSGLRVRVRRPGIV